MKNIIKLFVVVLAVAFVFISCEKGGTIEVTNGYDGPNLVVIVKGADLVGALQDLGNGKGTVMDKKGATKKFTYDEDGIYTVVASFPAGFSKPVTLLLGNTEKVTIK